MAHLSLEELACHDGTPYPAKWVLTRFPRLTQAFETIRALWGQPIEVLSGYRTPEYNRKVGGAKLSLHVQGLAMDLRPPEGVAVKDFWLGILGVAQKAGIGGIGYASPEQGNYVHVDCREANPPVQWRYPLTA